MGNSFGRPKPSVNIDLMVDALAQQCLTGSFASALEEDGIKPTSCNANAKLLGDFISDNQIRPVQKAKNVQGLITAIDEARDQDEVVYVNVSPDHHFLVIPIGTDRIALFQAFEGSYSAQQWAQANRYVFQDSSCKGNLRKLLSKDASQASEGAKALFAIPGQEDAISDWFVKGKSQDALPYIVTVAMVQPKDMWRV